MTTSGLCHAEENCVSSHRDNINFSAFWITFKCFLVNKCVFDGRFVIEDVYLVV